MNVRLGRGGEAYVDFHWLRWPALAVASLRWPILAVVGLH